MVTYVVRHVKAKGKDENFVHECVAYVRVSTKSQAETGVSLDTQRDIILKYCSDPKHKCHLDPGRIYVDEGKSAFKSYNQRKGYQNAKMDIEKGRADTLIIYSLSRAFRSVREAVETMNLLQKYDADIISITESAINTTTKTGRFVYYLFGVLGQFESEQLSERITDNMLHNFEETGFNGTRKPTGYQFVKEWIPIKKQGRTEKILRVVPPYYLKENNGERAKVERIFKMYRQGFGQRKIREEIDMTLSVIGWIISSPLYAGYLLYSTKKGEYRIKKGDHVPFISREEFNKNVDRRMKRMLCARYHKKNPPFKVFEKNGIPYVRIMEIK